LGSGRPSVGRRWIGTGRAFLLARTVRVCCRSEPDIQERWALGTIEWRANLTAVFDSLAGVRMVCVAAGELHSTSVRSRWRCIYGVMVLCSASQARRQATTVGAIYR
jgi:hypothetical protein